MKAKKNIAVVDDHTLFRKGIISLLREFPEINIKIEAGNGQELLALLKTKKIQVVLLDISMPVMDGIETVSHLKQKHSDVKIIMLSQHFDEQTIYHLMEKGAHGFLPKNADVELIVDAIYAVIERGYYFTDAVSKAMVKGAAIKTGKDPFIPQSLSPREIDVVKLICKQMSVAEIGEKLFLSPRTIDSHITSIYKKTGVKKREGIVFYAIEHDII